MYGDELYFCFFYYNFGDYDKLFFYYFLIDYPFDPFTFAKLCYYFEIVDKLCNEAYVCKLVLELLSCIYNYEGKEG